jgi:hypothetical protein
MRLPIYQVNLPFLCGLIPLRDQYGTLELTSVEKLAQEPTRNPSRNNAPAAFYGRLRGLLYGGPMHPASKSSIGAKLAGAITGIGYRCWPSRLYQSHFWPAAPSAR